MKFMHITKCAKGDKEFHQSSLLSGSLCSRGEGWCSRCGEGEGAGTTSRAEKHLEMEEARGILTSHHLQLQAGELRAGHQKCQRVRVGGAASGEEHDGQELGLSRPHRGERAWKTDVQGLCKLSQHSDCLVLNLGGIL